MVKTSLKRVLFVRNLWRRSVVLFVLGLMVISGVAMASVVQPRTAVAANNGTVNFQARLLNSGGSVVQDGNYNVEFKIYSAKSSSGSGQGSCSGDASCLWTETRTGSDAARVVDGYLTVNLGSVNPFPSDMPWSQNLWLSMDIGGSGNTPNWDGEMTPRLKLTATPYAFQAGSLSSSNNGYTSTLKFNTPSQDNNILLPDEGGTVCLDGSSNCGFLTGSSANGSYIQNQSANPQPANFYIQSAATNKVGAIIQGANSQTSDLLQLENNSGTVFFKVSHLGYLSLGSAADSGSPGRVYLADGSGDGFSGQLSTATLTQDQTYTLPDSSGTLCLTSGNCAGAGSGITGGDTQAGYVPVFDSSGKNLIDSNIFQDASSGNIGIGTTNPQHQLDVAGDINANGGIYTNNTLRLDAIGNLSNIGDITASGNESLDGNFSVAGTIQQNNTSEVYKWRTAGNTDTAWKTIATVTEPGTGEYIGTSFEVDVGDSQGSWGNSANEIGLKYYVSIKRTETTTDDRDTATVSGPISDYVRVVKTSNSTYELQVRQPTIYVHVDFTSQVTSNDKGVVTYHSNPADGATSGTVYMPKVLHTDYATNLNVAGALTVQGTAKSSFAGDLKVDGTATVDTLSVTNDASVGGNLTVSGTSTLKTLKTTGNATIGSDLRVSGHTYMNHSLELGSGASDYGALLNINTDNPGNIGLVVQASHTAQTQTADLLQLQNSSGTALSGFDSSGNLFYQNSGYTLTLDANTLTANRTIHLPDATGTICLQDSTDCGFAQASPSGNGYIQNTTMQQTNANFNIDGTGTMGTLAVTNGATIGGLALFNDGNAHYSEQGGIAFQNASNGTEWSVGTAGTGRHDLFFLDTNDTEPTLALTNTGDVGIGTGSPSAPLTVQAADNRASAFTLLDNSGNSALEIRTGDASDNNTFIGKGAGLNNTTGAENTSNGVGALEGNTTGNNNTALGYRAGEYSQGYGSNKTTSNSVYLGDQTLAQSDGDTNEIVIGSGATGHGSNSVTLGNGSITTTVLQGNIGIGTDSPSYAFDVQGGNGTDVIAQFNGQVLGADAVEGSAFTTKSQVQTWIATATGDGSAANAFLQGGNSFGAAAVLGTNDGYALQLETNGSTALTIDTSGNIGIGTTSPNHKLDVAGDFNVNGSVFTNNTERIDGGGNLTNIGTYSGSGDITTSGNASVDGNLTAGGQVNSANGYYSGGTQRLDGSGNLVNIGDITASGNESLGGKLTVGGDLTASGSGNFAGVNSNGGDVIVQGKTNPALQLLSSNAGSAGVSILSDGQSIQLGNNTTHESFAYFSAEAPADSLYLSSNGYLGLGTTNPAYALDVQGGDGSSPIAQFNGQVLGADAQQDNALTTLQQVKDLIGGSGAGTGVTEIGTLDAGTQSAKGASISGTTLYLQSATASYPGLVTTGAQTFGGDKTFNGAVTIGGTLNVQSTAQSSFAGDLSVSGTSTLGKLTVNGNASFANNLDVSGTTTLKTLKTTGTATVDSTLTVSGISYLNSQLQLGGDAADYGAMLNVNTEGAGNVGIAVRANSTSQTADLLQFQSSRGGTALSGFNAAGNLFYQNSGYTLTLDANTLTANHTIHLPDATGTICLQDAADCGFALASPSGNGYIQNTTMQQANANFNISGTGIAGTSLQAPSFDTAGNTTLSIGNNNATGVQIGNTGVDNLTTIYGSALVKSPSSGDAADTFQVQNANGDKMLSVDASHHAVVIGQVPSGQGLGAAASLYFGDTCGNFSQTCVKIGEYDDGTTHDSDKLQLHGANGVVFTTGYNTQNVVGQVKKLGAVEFQNTSNSTSAFQVNNHAGSTTVLDVDTSNSRVGIGTAAPGYALDVHGSINTSGQYLVNGVQIASGNLKDGTNLAKLDANQTFTAHNIFQSNTAKGFEIQNSSDGSDVLQVDTADGKVAVGTAANLSSSPYKLVVAQNTNADTISAVVNGYSGKAAYLRTDANSNYSGLQIFGSNQDWVAGELGSTAFSIQDATNSVTPFSIQPSSPANALTINGNGVGIGMNDSNASYKLEVSGNVNIPVGSQYLIGGNPICTSDGCKPSSNSGNYIQNTYGTATVQQTAAFNISGNGTVGSNLMVGGDSAFSGNVTLGSASSGALFDANHQLTFSGSARHTKRIRLAAEYANMVLDPGAQQHVIGTMTTGYDMTSRMSYYNWTTKQTDYDQTYDMVVQVPIPNDFDGFSGNLHISTYTTDVTNGTVKAEIVTSGNQHPLNFVSASPTAANTWHDASLTIPSGTYTAGDYLTIIIRPSSISNANVRIGNIYMDYKAKF
jgi:hypothetical protein